MSLPRLRTLRRLRRADIIACAPDFVLQHHGVDTCGQIARHLGLSNAGVRYHVRNESELIRLVCQAHLTSLFEAVCRQVGRPLCLPAMARALLDAADTHAARHRVYLLHRFMLTQKLQCALDAQRRCIDNAFHCALYDANTGTPFCAARAPARALVGELLHAPLWWRAETPTFRTNWLANRIAFASVLPKEEAQAASWRD